MADMTDNREIAVKVSGVKKKYKLGQLVVVHFRQICRVGGQRSEEKKIQIPRLVPINAVTEKLLWL